MGTRGGNDLTLPIPDLDDKSFDQLIDDARSLIPLYAPQWTDHNASDPGITFIELFAWLIESEIYRINLITDRHKLKYLKLLGIKPNSRMPAKVDLTIHSNSEETISKGTVISTDVSDKSIYFELDEDITIVPVNLKKIIVDESTAGVFDRTGTNEDGDLFYPPFGLNVKKHCALYLGFDKGPVTLSFACYLYEKDLIEPGEHGYDILKNEKLENVRLRWEISSPSDGTNWVGISPVDGTDNFNKSGRIIFKSIKGWKSSTIAVWKDDNDTQSQYFWIRCVIEKSCYEYPPRIETIRLNTVPAVQGLTIKDGGEQAKGSGLPYQVVNVRSFPVRKGTVRLCVNVDEWREVDDLDGSGPDDLHFILDEENGTIGFGDDINGMIPSADSIINIIQYRTCNGEEGNVKHGLEWEIEGFNGIIQNLRPSIGGADAENVEKAIERFIIDLKKPYRAVTSKDFEFITRNTPGLRVAIAKAVPNYNPYYNKYSEGAVTMVVIPFTPLDIFETPPEPSESFKDRICHHLDKHRLLCTDIYIVPPVYVKVDINITIVLKPGFSDEVLRQNVISKLNRFLNPIRGWVNGKGWPVGRDVFRSEIYSLIEEIDGVDCVIRLLQSGDKGSITDTQGNLVLPLKTATVYPGSHTINIIKELDECIQGGKVNAKN